MIADSWFEDPASLLDELKKGEAARWARPTIPGYDELREIGRGGQGLVYSARQLSTRRSVAIKVLFDEGSAHRRARVEREIDLVSALRHPGIVRVYDGGITADGRFFIVMELIEGHPLDECDFGSGRQVLELFVGVCDAVHHAHQRGIIHRDLKPSNVVVDGDGAPHVLDFGIARETRDGRAAPDSVTLTGQFVGTLAYASPEQLAARSELLDVRTDVYSLGVLLYELLCRKPLHDPALSMAELISAITEGQVPPTNLGVELDTIVRTALATEPDRRYPSAEALGKDLSRYLVGDPIWARRDRVTYVVGKFLLRHKLSVGLGLTALLVLVVGSVALAVLYGRASREAEENQQVRIFLEDTWGSVEPTRLGSEVTVREELDEALHWVDLVLDDRPEVAAALLTTIGNGYRNLGLYDRAETQLQRALTLRLKAFGGSHLDVAQSLNALALLHVDRSQLDSAEELFRRALGMRERHAGPESYEVSLSFNNLAGVARRRGEWDQAEHWYRKSLALRERLRGQDHPDVAMCLFRLAQLEEARGNTDGAVALHRQALAAREARLHPDHPDLAASYRTLGLLLARSPNAEEGELLLRKALAHRQRSLPAGHWRVAEVAIEVGETSLLRGRIPEAEDPLRLALETLSAQGEAADPLRRRAAAGLTTVCEATNRPEEAARYRALARPQ